MYYESVPYRGEPMCDLARGGDDGAVLHVHGGPPRRFDSDRTRYPVYKHDTETNSVNRQDRRGEWMMWNR